MAASLKFHKSDLYQHLHLSQYYCFPNSHNSNLLISEHFQSNVQDASQFCSTLKKINKNIMFIAGISHVPGTNFCSSLHFSFCGKAMTKKQLGEEKVYFILHVCCFRFHDETEYVAEIHHRVGNSAHGEQEREARNQEEGHQGSP